MAFNLCAMYSTRPEVTAMNLRISSAGVILAPASAPGATITHTASSGVYVVTPIQNFAEFLGAQAQIETSTIPGTAAGVLTEACLWTPPSGSTRGYLTVTIFNSASTPAGTDSAFALQMMFSDSRVA